MSFTFELGSSVSIHHSHDNEERGKLSDILEATRVYAGCHQEELDLNSYNEELAGYPSPKG